MLSNNATLIQVILTLLICSTTADRTCRWNGLCSAPFPPGKTIIDHITTAPMLMHSSEGHKYMGTAWWAIGDPNNGAIIKTMTTTLMVPERPKTLSGVLAINTAMENSVNIDSHTHRKPVTDVNIQNIHDQTDSYELDETFQTITAVYPDGWNQYVSA